MDEKAREGMTRPQFAKYGLLRLGVGQDLTRIIKVACQDASRPPKKCSSSDPISDRQTDHGECSRSLLTDPQVKKRPWGWFQFSPSLNHRLYKRSLNKKTPGNGMSARPWCLFCSSFARCFCFSFSPLTTALIGSLLEKFGSSNGC